MNIALIFDCGSTNLRVAAINEQGEIVAQANTSNFPVPQPGHVEWLTWDIDGIWVKLCRLSKQVVNHLERAKIEAVAVTTWGADGALVKRDGCLAYPAISWQCQRTREVVPKVLELISPREIFRITGYQAIYFNTLFKLYWIKKNAPEAFREAYTWLMMPGLIVHRLCSEFHVDPTSASTTMSMDLGKRDWSSEMLALAGLEPSFFPEWVEPGEIIGFVNEDASKLTGIPNGVPVVAAGHDTQFAILAAGAGEREAILSSGTWEILALRSNSYDPNEKALELGMIIEADAERGKCNPQLLMIASAVIEWLKNLVYPELGPSEYTAMVNEARKVEPGSGGLILIPSFVPDSGPLSKYGMKGAILGLQLSSSRGQLYRAAMEGLSIQLRLALESLEQAFSFKAKGVRVVGGGSKNDLWNQIRADVLGLPVSVPRFSEATILGAAVVAFRGTGVYKSFEEGLRAISGETRVFKPESNEIYDSIYRRFLTTLETFSKLS
ncbi:MAG: FGGY family carbohydrate kinase [Thermofilaceae archaeon]